MQWLSGRVLDSRLRGSGFEPHPSHCVVVLEQDTFRELSGSVIECLTRDRRVVGLSLNGVTALCH